MFSVSKTIHFSYGHRLIHHKGKCAHVHGHNAVVEVLCSRAKLDRRSMVVDFDEITRALKEWIDQTLDHRLILNREDPLVSPLKKLGEKHLTLNEDPTAEVMAELIFRQAQKAGLPVTRVIFWETPHSKAIFSK